jgi:signal transduction histidine kinase
MSADDAQKSHEQPGVDLLELCDDVRRPETTAPPAERDVFEQKRAERKLRRERRRLKRMLRLYEHEHRLIAYEIHDGLVQEITGAHMRLEALLQDEELGSPRLRAEVRCAAGLCGRALAEARRLIDGLRPPVLDERGVVAAVRHLIEERGAATPAIEFSAEPGVERLDPLLEVSLYRIVQEGIANATRHSGSDRVRVRLSQVGGRVQLEIRDWGRGFDPQHVGASRFGLQGIRERARLLRGRATIDSAPAEGTRVFVDLPATVEARQKVVSLSRWRNP